MTTIDSTAFAGSHCLVTGGLGFIGSNVVQRLAGAGAEVQVVDSLVPKHGGNRHNLDGARGVAVTVSDIAEASTVAPLLSGVDFIFNLAGQVSHVESMEDPLRDLELNARSQLAFLETVRGTGLDAPIVYASTRQIYGRPRYVPVDETHPVDPVDINGIAKAAGEQFHTLYARLGELQATSLRITNSYGPRQRLRGDDQGFLPIFIRRAFEDQPITLYGDGGQLRDCLHVDDVVDALLLAALTPEAVGEVFNIGHRDSYSLKVIAETITSAVGKGSIVHVPWPQERSQIDIGSFHSDISKAKAALGWEPAIELAEGIASTIEFYREHLNWYL